MVLFHKLIQRKVFKKFSVYYLINNHFSFFINISNNQFAKNIVCEKCKKEFICNSFDIKNCWCFKIPPKIINYTFKILFVVNDLLSNRVKR